MGSGRNYLPEHLQFLYAEISKRITPDKKRLDDADVNQITSEFNEKYNQARSVFGIGKCINRIIRREKILDEAGVYVYMRPGDKKESASCKAPMIPTTIKGAIAHLHEMEKILKASAKSINAVCIVLQQVAKENQDMKTEMRALCEVRKAVEKFQTININK